MKRENKNSLKLSWNKMRKARKNIVVVTDKDLIEKIRNCKFVQDKLARANETLKQIKNLSDIIK